MMKVQFPPAPPSNGLALSALLENRIADVTLVRALRRHFSSIEGVAGVLLLGACLAACGSSAAQADLHIILEVQSVQVLRAILSARQGCEAELGVLLNVSCHTLGEANPSLARSGLFAAPVGGSYFVLRAKYSGVLISGRNVFVHFTDPSPARLRSEVIGTIGSYRHRLREILLTNPDSAAEFARIPLLTLELAACFHGYLSLGHEDARAYLRATGWLEEEEDGIIAACVDALATGGRDAAPLPLAEQTLHVLERFHRRLLDLYRRRGISAIRWDGENCRTGWSLEQPQAASMTIIRAGDAVLVMRRPADDYLYPNSWTIPGGYLDAGELPVTAAAREIAEETGLFIKPEALFGGEPVMSDRLAAFCFIAHIGTPQTLHMSEHDAYRFIHLADVPRLELTREARLILERYLAVSEPAPRYLSEMSGAS